MGFNLGMLGAAFRGQQEYDEYLQAKKLRDMQLAQLQAQNDPRGGEMFYKAMDAYRRSQEEQGAPAPMPGQASVPNQPQEATQMPQGGPQQGAPMPQQGMPAQMPPAPPIPPYRALNPDVGQSDAPQGMPRGAVPGDDGSAPVPAMPNRPVPQGTGMPGEMGKPGVPQPVMSGQAPSSAPVQLKHGMRLTDLQKFIEQQFPNESSAHKFKALEMGHKYLSDDAKVEFQEKTLEMKERVAEMTDKLKHEILAEKDKKDSASEARLSRLEGGLTQLHQFQGLLAQANALAAPIRANAAKETADAHMIAAQAQKARAATAEKQLTSGKVDDETADWMARQYWAGDKSVFANLGRGKQGGENVIAVRKRVREIGQEEGKTPQELAMATAEFAGINAAERTLGTRIANVGMAVNEADSLADLAVNASGDWKRLNLKTLNDVQKYAQSHTESKTLRKFVASNNSFINAYARAISPQGTPTVPDKEHAREMLEVGFSKGDYEATIEQLKLEMQAAKSSPAKAKQEIRDLATGKGASGNKQVFSSKAELDAAVKAGKIKKGDTFSDPSGAEHTVN